MAGQLAIKRLTPSDLTLFDYQYNTAPAGKQKAINLNRDVLVDQIYPALSQSGIMSSERYPVDLYLYGPGLAGEYNLQRKILKQQKNWRLNGELVYNPPDDPGRFNILQPEDLVVFDFSEGLFPLVVRAVFLAQTSSDDLALHTVLNQALGTESMLAVPSADLPRLIAQAAPPQAHPIYGLVLDAEIEDAVAGGSIAEERIVSRPNRRPISWAELLRARENNSRLGRLGEQFVNDYLSQLKSSGQIANYDWASDVDALSPFDFRVSPIGESSTVADVKTTRNGFDAPIFVSYNELKIMADEPYALYRVFDIEGDTAQLCIATNLQEFAKGVLAIFSQLPEGVLPDGISLAPSKMSFGSPVQLRLTQEPEGDEQ